jgi:hypothetical protein
MVAGLALPALLPSRGQAAGKANITVGITVDTRPDWNGPQNFIRSIQEASEVGYHWVETFWPYVSRWENNPQGLRDELEKRNLKLETISNGAPMRTDFVDPSQRAGVISSRASGATISRSISAGPARLAMRRRPTRR